MRRNTIYQFLWYNLIRPKADRTRLIDPVRINKALQFSAKFGGAKMAIMGDSNGATLDTYSLMRDFDELSINLAMPGTRADHWMQFIENEAQNLIPELNKLDLVINIGGNHVLQDSMNNAYSSLEKLGKMFPNAFWINLPAIHSRLFAEMSGRPHSIIMSNLIQINEMIADVATRPSTNIRPRLIDVKHYTGSSESDPYFFVHQDLVHYSKLFEKKIRIPLIKAHLFR